MLIPNREVMFNEYEEKRKDYVVRRSQEIIDNLCQKIADARHSNLPIYAVETTDIITIAECADDILDMITNFFMALGFYTSYEYSGCTLHFTVRWDVDANYEE